MDNEIKERLKALRDTLRSSGLDACIIFHADPHQSEYLAKHWQVRRYLSGFTGSAGTLVVTLDKAALWTDSRYFIQAARQLEGTGIELMRDGLADTPSFEEWLIHELPDGATVGVDGWLLTASAFDGLRKQLSNNGRGKYIGVDENFDPIDKLWVNRPALPNDKAFIHEVRYAGETVRQKLDRIMMCLAAKEVDATFISALDEIAWTLNMRGTDVRCNPVNTAFLYISSEQKVLFIEPEKLTPDVKEHLSENGVTVIAYSSVDEFLHALPMISVAVDYGKTAAKIVELLGSRCVNSKAIIASMKAIKNDVEIEGFRNAMCRDGAALVNAFMEIEERLAKGMRTTERDVSSILRRCRQQQPLFFDESFDTIAGYGPHGAIVHYTATEDTDSVLAPCGLLLVDSGAQYLDGTTDITRTIALGEPTDNEKRDFTLVLKGMMAVAMAVFPEGTRGIQLDTLAHQYLWRAGQNYMHGTGHGIGHFLNVHEGPFSIRNNGANWDLPLEPGMVTSDEPGLYKEGVHGIRCENVLLVRRVDIEGSDSFRYLGFETLTLFPFDLSLVDVGLMSPDEIKWLDSYHRLVYDKLSPLLGEEAREWLKRKTQPLK